MKKIKLLCLFILIALFSSCGGSDSTSTKDITLFTIGDSSGVITDVNV